MNHLKRKLKLPPFVKKLTKLGNFWDSVYSAATNSYYVYECSKEAIFRKGIDSNEPELWLPGVKNYAWQGKALRLACDGKALIKIGGNGIDIVCVDSKEIKSVAKPVQDWIIDFKPLSQNNGQQVICVTKTNQIWVLSYDFKANHKKVIAQADLGVLNERKEAVSCMAVCPESKLATIATEYFDPQSSSFLLSRVIVCNVTIQSDGSSGQISFLKAVDYQGKGVQLFHSIEFAGNFGGSLLIVGLNKASESKLLVFEYKDGGELVEVEELRHQVKGFQHPYQIVRTEKGKLFATDKKSKLLKLVVLA